MPKETREIVIEGGKVITRNGPRRANVLVRGEKIAAVGRMRGEGLSRHVQVIDASGCIVMPGAIDCHVHFQLPIAPGMTTADDFSSGTKAAAAAGITTVIDYTTPLPGQQPLDAFRARRAQADGQVSIDYSLHNVLIGFEKGWARQLGRLRALGAPSVKVFLIYADRGWQTDDGRLVEIMNACSRSGLVVCVHAENDALIRHYSESAAGAKGALALARARPPIVEVEAVQRVVLLARHTGARTHLVHLSCPESVELVSQARKRGIAVSAETCPQYLALDERLLARPDGHLWGCCPPLRRRELGQKLLQLVCRGAVQAMVTDHCAFSRRQKDRWEGDFRRIPYGLAGVETSLAVTWTLGPAARRMPLWRWQWLHTEGPARLFGLWPRKGSLRPGSDADIVVWDPQARWTPDPRRMETSIDWSPYRGMKLRGRARMVFLRGTLVASNGRFCGPDGRGRFLKRSPP
ncbi:MAG: dihydropyrimidinase [Deltaproteobacteria bacterium]|nr:MAG: dihydropyrimidinase [Deltaproteobacteria bacterium]